ncbi:MAG TPA: NAD(P)H-dependent dehydrogenase/reductase [Candidatus Marinimicrobia bacterium]|nr:NAD(P)H-dependent dehydrogenase/reductase [Candidatus Neomarinimicrobiota bacterium]
MLELLRQRRSIRKYKSRLIEPDKIEILKEALLRSPTSRNLRPWEFIFVDDKETLKRLSESKENGSAFLKDAALGIIITADETVSDVWIEDCSIAAIIVQLSAQSIGLGSCWIQIRNRFTAQGVLSEQYIRQLLGLDDSRRIECIVALGYPDEKKTRIPYAELDFRLITSSKSESTDKQD